MNSIGIGDATVTRIEESFFTDFKAATFFADWRPEVVDEHRRWLVPGHYDERRGVLNLSVHSWLVRTGRHTVLVDTCVGNDKRSEYPAWHMKSWPYLDRLAAAGVTPEQVDFVLCTHMHIDHIGWNTRLENGRWVPTFPNARYVFSKTEFEAYSAIDRNTPGGRPSFRDSVLPVVEAGRAQMVEGSHALDDHFLIEPAPGHTPGHVTIKLSAGEDRAIFIGDIMHHALQVYYPTWNSESCADGVQARATRRRVLEHCADSGALMLPAHFGAPFACHIEARGDAFVPRFYAGQEREQPAR
jgi:glyoxylase-like metal-dependent hydrolase (beta-lactamase superfamily II)